MPPRSNYRRDVALPAGPGEPVRLTVPTGPIDVTVKQTRAGTATSFVLNLRKGEERRVDVVLDPIEKD